MAAADGHAVDGGDHRLGDVADDAMEGLDLEDAGLGRTVVPGLLALLETCPVIADRKELDLPFAEFGETNSFDWDWWPAL